MITERFHMLHTKHAAYVRKLREAAAENRMADAMSFNAEVDAVRQSIMIEALRMVGVPDEEISGMAERALIGHHRRGRAPYTYGEHVDRVFASMGGRRCGKTAALEARVDDAGDAIAQRYYTLEPITGDWGEPMDGLCSRYVVDPEIAYATGAQLDAYACLAGVERREYRELYKREVKKESDASLRQRVIVAMRRKNMA